MRRDGKQVRGFKRKKSRGEKSIMRDENRLRLSKKYGQPLLIFGYFAKNLYLSVAINN
jgi:hypothetical protein